MASIQVDFENDLRELEILDSLITAKNRKTLIDGFKKYVIKPLNKKIDKFVKTNFPDDDDEVLVELKRNAREVKKKLKTVFPK